MVKAWELSYKRGTKRETEVLSNRAPGSRLEGRKEGRKEGREDEKLGEEAHYRYVKNERQGTLETFHSIFATKK